MGWVEGGKYHKGKPDMDKLRSTQHSGHKSWDHNRQKKDFAREIIQPYDRSGKPNEDFIQAYPEEAQGYGFIPNNDDLIKE